MFRREWRQQFLVLALLTTAVATSIGFACAAYLITPVPDNAEFGAASHVIRLSGASPEGLVADVAAAEAAFDTHEVIYHRPVPVPGLFAPIDYRAQHPDGPLGGPRLALREGAYPAGSEVAVTDGVAELFGLDIGGSLTLDGQARPIVGIIENPGDLTDEFVLVPASQSGGAAEATVLVNADEDQVLSFRNPSGSSLAIGSRQANQHVVAALGVLLFSTIGLLLIALIATASFVVIAHRRIRQLGMLAAIGATEKQLRLVTVANGTVIGSIAAVLGAAIGVAGWIGVAPLVENPVGFRVDQFDIPLWLVASGMLLAVFAGTAAAWWPARGVARVPTVHALSGRPPRPKPARRAAALAAGLAVVGVACLVLSGDFLHETGVDWAGAGLLVAGTAAVALGLMFACPLAIRLLATAAARLPVAARLATGDLARYRARSGAALAAISLAVAVSVTLIAATAAAQADSDEGNLGHGQVLLRAADVDGPFIPPADAIGELRVGVDRVAGALDGNRVTELAVAIDPASTPDPALGGREAIVLGKRIDDGWRDVSLVYVATPQLLAYYGYHLDEVTATLAVITRETGQLAFIGDIGPVGSRPETVAHLEPLPAGYDSLPGTFLTTQAISERGWVTAASGRWLVETGQAPTTGQLDAARELAAGAGLTIEVRDPQAGLGALQTGATAAGILVALGIVAMAVGLVRSEAARDLRILTATGATRRTRRAITATTAGGLATLGVIVGTAGAYVGLTAGFAQDLSALAPPPVAHLAALVLGLPLAAALAGWLISGRGVGDITRQPLG